MDVPALAAQQLPQKPGDVPAAQIRLQVLREDLHHPADVRDVPECDELRGAGLQEAVLHLDAAEIGVRIHAAKAAESAVFPRTAASSGRKTDYRSMSYFLRTAAEEALKSMSARGSVRSCAAR